MSKNIINYNAKRQLHGYQERYWLDTGKLRFKCFYNNGDEIDYEEYYPFNGGKLDEKIFYI